MSRSLLRTLAGTATLALVTIGSPALAHVTVNPDTAEGGGYDKLTFRVPTESATASTTKVQVFLPADHPFGSVSVQPVAGWTYKVAEKKLATPLTTDDGQVTQAVSQITWTAASKASAIKPGQFQEFGLSLGPLPDSGSLIFKALQTYSDGKVVRWIEPQVEGAAEPEHPAPTLTITSGADGSGTSTADSGGDSRSGWALGLSGLAVVIAAGGTALGLRRKP
ncbi:YcnI family copper-binding membrane protein [Nocardioides montaniterrae]